MDRINRRNLMVGAGSLFALRAHAARAQGKPKLRLLSRFRRLTFAPKPTRRWQLR